MTQQYDLEIEKLVQGGAGLARLPADATGRRRVVFVPFTLPGEQVRVEVDGKRVRLFEVLRASPERVTPGCEYFGRCGGCQLQHTGPEHQLRLKREILLETLQRLGGVVWSGAVQEHAAEAWGYRNRVRMQAVPGVGVGYFEAASHRVLPVTHCPIASPALNGGIAELTVAPPREPAEVELAVDNAEGGLHTDDPLRFVVAGRNYQVSPGAFFQSNRFLAAELIAVVTQSMSGRTALDLFSGVGLFALPLAETFAQLEAVESHPVAAADLRQNLDAVPGTAITVAAMPALAYLRQRAVASVDLLVADPPRAGLGPELVEALVALAPARMHLVSCDAATLARDLRPLLAAGYAITELHLFDLFPQTAHMETVVKLIRS